MSQTSNQLELKSKAIEIKSKEKTLDRLLGPLGTRVFRGDLGPWDAWEGGRRMWGVEFPQGPRAQACIYSHCTLCLELGTHLLCDLFMRFFMTCFPIYSTF